MPTIKDAVTVLGIVLGCCILVSLGAYWGKKATLGKLVQAAGIIALIAIIIYVIYVAWYSFAIAK